MQVVEGNLWHEVGRADLILVTSNASVNRFGELVMGRGAAAQAKQRIPQLAEMVGNTLASRDQVGKKYGLVLVGRLGQPGPTAYGVFQCKYRWYENADLELIDYSTEMLIRYLKKAVLLVQPRVAMNYPGIGFGSLREQDVQPIVEKLPDSVSLYKYPTTRRV